MLPLHIPAGTTIDSLLRSVIPALHHELVPEDVPADPIVVTVRIEGARSYTVRIRGREMAVAEGEAERPTLWVFTTARVVQRFLEDATGPRRLVPDRLPHDRAVLVSDPRLVKRAALSSGRLELALPDVDGERLAVVLGFGPAARKPIDPEDADAVVEGSLEILRRMLDGELAPDVALAEGAVRVRGNRLLPLQLALAAAPFFAPTR